MKDVVIVETRDPIEVRDVEWSAGLLARARQAGCASTLMLAENGVLGARASAPATFLSRLVEQGVAVLADRFALAERGIFEADLTPGIDGVDLGFVVDRLAAGDLVLWR